MSRKRGIGLVVVVAVICPVLSSFLTVVVLKNNLGFSSNKLRKILSLLGLYQPCWKCFN